MSSNTNIANIFTVTLDLSKYYEDYRKFTIILVKDTFKTIQDVKQHIENLFKIKDFYLTIAQHYLPAAEDVRILRSKKIVCVHPLNQVEAAYELFNDTSALDNTVPNTPTKRRLEEPHNALGEDDTDYKKYKTNHQVHDTNLSNNATFPEKDLSKTEVPVLMSTPITVLDSVLENKQIHESQEIVSQEVLTPFKPNKCSMVSPTLPETAVRLSRQADTTVQQYTKYIPPQRITDEHISKKRVNIVKVEYLTKPGVLAGNDKTVPSDGQQLLSECSKDFPRKNYVKIMISEFEKVIPSGKVDAFSENQTEEASNYTQIYLNQKAANTSCINQSFSDEKIHLDFSEPKKQLGNLQILKHDANQQLLATDLSHGTLVEDDVISLPSSGSVDAPVLIGPIRQNETCSLKNSEPISYIVDGVQENNMNDSNNLNEPSISEMCIDSSCDLVIRNISTPSQELNAVIDIPKSPKESKIKKSSTGFGIGAFLGELRDISSVFSQESDVSSAEHVKKRKRLRKRVRKSKSKKVEPLFIPAQCEISMPEIAPNTHRVHIRFDDQGRAVNQDEGPSVEVLMIDKKCSVPTETEKSSVAPQVEAMPIANEKDVLMEDKPIFTEENIENSPSMKDRLEPKIGDIIAFKILKISENYTPQLSGCIIGKVANYVSEVVSFKILSGMQEFANPTGKFFIDLDAEAIDVEAGYKELLWENVVEPKLLFP